MRAVIFVNGRVEDYASLAHWLAASDYLICADGGVAHCLALGRRPHVIVGDLDSAPEHLIGQWQDQGVQIERHPAEKDQTDLELAIERALRDGAGEILLLGAMGGRLDQSVANVLLLAQRRWAVPIRLAEGNQVAQVVRGGETLVLEETEGDTVSVIPLSDRVTGISYGGLAYPLESASLSLGTTRGISNVIARVPASIRVEAGILLVIRTLRT